MPDRGVIHDIGYQRYEGPRLGRAYANRSLFVHSLRSAFGLRRSAWAKVVPMGITGLACLAALILVVINTQVGQVIDYVGIAATFVYAASVFVAVVAPELVSVDLRANLLPLYLSRPLRRSDYPLTKYAALAAATFIMVGAPMVVLFLGMAFDADGLGGVLEEAGGLLAGFAAAAIHALVLAAIALPLASLSKRRVFATGMIIAIVLVSTPVYGILTEFASGDLRYLAGLVNPTAGLNGIDRWLFDAGTTDVGSYGPVYGLVALVVVVLGVALTVLRYRKVKT